MEEQVQGLGNEQGAAVLLVQLHGLGEPGALEGDLQLGWAGRQLEGEQGQVRVQEQGSCTGGELAPVDSSRHLVASGKRVFTGGEMSS